MGAGFETVHIKTKQTEREIQGRAHSVDGIVDSFAHNEGHCWMEDLC